MLHLDHTAITEQQLEETVFQLWEAGKDWHEIADAVYIPIEELLTRPAIADLFYK